MAFNFPATPAISQVFTAPTGVEYIWNGYAWLMVPADGGGGGGASITIADTPPPGAEPGAMWYESDTGNTFIWYDDGDSQQWVQQNIQPSPSTGPLPGLTANTRNRIVNGAMQISQEWGNTALGPAAVLDGYSADQFNTGSSVSPGAASYQRVQVVTPNRSQNRLRISVTTAKAALATTDNIRWTQWIEGTRVADFGWGTANAKQVVVRFGFKGPAGTYSMRLINLAGNRCWIANFTISAGQANTDTEQIFVIPGDTTGVWPIDTGIGMSLAIAMAAGPTVQGVVGWNTSSVYGTSASTNGMATVGNVFELFDVGLYLDPLATGVAPRWEMPDEAQELQACLRYWRTNPTILGAWGGSASQFRVAMPLIPPMRVIPASAVLATTNRIEQIQVAFKNIGGAPTSSWADANNLTLDINTATAVANYPGILQNGSVALSARM